MAQHRTDSTDRTASVDVPDTWFYLPGMPSAAIGRGRVGRFLVTLLRRRGVLPADLLRER